MVTLVFLCLRLNTATSSPVDDVHHYVISQRLLDSIFNKLPVFMSQWKKKNCSLSGRSPAPIADSFRVVTMAGKHSVLNLREINRNNTHTDLVSVLTYYGWVYLICYFFRCNAEKCRSQWPRGLAWSAFARLNTGIVGSNPARSMDVCLRLFCICVVLCR
jgi:hypothetical protein